MKLQNRVAIVTGGGRGLGKVIALALAEEGARVVIAATYEPALNETAREITAKGYACLAVLTDVSKEEDAENMVSATLKEFGQVDILVNNSGIAGPTGPVVSIDRRGWDETLAVNLTGPFLCSRAALKNMIERKQGKIINISSVGGKRAYALRSPYAVSKRGLIALTETLALEVGQYNIQVNVICPGPVAGDRMNRVIENRAREMGKSIEEVTQFYVQATALKRMVEARDIADMVVFLASDSGNNITGQTISICGGYGL